MKVSLEFSKNALTYGLNNVIQNKVLDKLLSNIDTKPKYIVDLGCGSGELYSKIDWQYNHFIGVDFAKGMLELHPKNEKIELIYGDFNEHKLFDYLLTCKIDHLFSSSALQWAENLENLFQQIARLKVPIALAIFTSNTFKTLNETAKLSSILKSSSYIDKLQKKYFNATFEVVNYKLDFQSTREMFKYIKKSGVSGSRKKLNYKQTKELMKNYPLSYLEFEVVFIHSN